ncbi:hypothetical protein GCWU000342_02095 [Shuttleworthella satelles DSM 14600]|uniref:Uncharacterized protein n=1 Tax=Shuttleworthella satelles DSM 14600 TaxID=626523 RepID=C4GDC1_9FIRM|nr:hypothetical protein GCWU000342_02095 [Shuttleworthia satelles DSM 14600]
MIFFIPLILLSSHSPQFPFDLSSLPTGISFPRQMSDCNSLFQK